MQITTTRDGSTPHPAMSRSRAVCVMVTSTVENSTSHSSTRRWFALGSVSTVCRMLTTGTVSSGSTWSSASPSGPGKMPYSCWMTATS